MTTAFMFDLFCQSAKDEDAEIDQKYNQLAKGAFYAGALIALSNILAIDGEVEKDEKAIALINEIEETIESL